MSTTAKSDGREDALTGLIRLSREHASDPDALLPESLVRYIATSRTGTVDYADFEKVPPELTADCACYGIWGDLPEAVFPEGMDQSLRTPREGEDERQMQRRVLQEFAGRPDVRARHVLFRNLFWMERARPEKTTVKQRLITFAFGIGRKLPLGLKIRLKKMAMKVLMK
ncbi:MAG: hypothetical protein K6E92_04195 [Lachnospiraceae bacterium]|nr:hypothetical protein [Lachnospiraceae bacterium]